MMSELTSRKNGLRVRLSSQQWDLSSRKFSDLTEKFTLGYWKFRFRGKNYATISFLLMKMKYAT